MGSGDGLPVGSMGETVVYVLGSQEAEGLNASNLRQ